MKTIDGEWEKRSYDGFGQGLSEYAACVFMVRLSDDENKEVIRNIRLMEVKPK